MTKEDIEQLVSEGWTDREMAERLGMTRDGVAAFRYRNGIQASPQNAMNRDTCVVRPTEAAETYWCGRLKGQRFEDHPQAGTRRGRVSRPATIIPSQSSAA